jgi:hypothetical protein
VDSFNDKVKEKVKKYSNKEYLNGYIKNEYLTGDGIADIVLKINNKNELFDSKTTGNQLALKKEIYEYIEDKTSVLDNDIQLNLKIISNELTQHDIEKVKHIISEHYAIELYKAQRKYRRYKAKFINQIIAGIIFILCYAIIVFSFKSVFFVEIFGFLFSFSLWHAIETYTLKLVDIKYARQEITQRLLMSISLDNK